MPTARAIPIVGTAQDETDLRDRRGAKGIAPRNEAKRGRAIARVATASVGDCCFVVSEVRVVRPLHHDGRDCAILAA